MSASDAINPHHCENSFMEDQEKIFGELNNSAFTFAQGANTNEESELLIDCDGILNNNNIKHVDIIEGQSSDNQQNLPNNIPIENINDPSNQCYEACAYCLRQFFKGRLALHQKSCRPSNPLKPLNILKISNIVQDILVPAQHQQPKSATQYTSQSRHSLHHSSLKNLQPLNSPKLAQKDDILQNLKLEESLVFSGQQQQQQLAIPKWRLEHQSLQLSLKSPKSPLHQTFDPIMQQYVSCQYCNRKFKPKVAEEHIPNCKNIFNRPKPPKISMKSPEMSHSVSSSSYTFKFDGLSGSAQPLELKRIASEDLGIFKEKNNSSRDSRSPQQDEKQIARALQQQVPKRARAGSKKGLGHLETSCDQSSQLTTQQSSSAKLSTFHGDVFEYSDALEQSVRSLKSSSIREAAAGSLLPSIFEKNPPKASRQKDTQAGFTNQARSNSSNQQQVDCPHCKRKFARPVAVRHIPICSRLQISKPICLMKKSLSQFTVNQKTLTMLFNKNKLSLDQEDTQDISGGFGLKDGPLIFCTNCGSKLSQTFKYCCSCGKKRSL